MYSVCVWVCSWARARVSVCVWLDKCVARGVRNCDTRPVGGDRDSGIVKKLTSAVVSRAGPLRLSELSSESAALQHPGLLVLQAALCAGFYPNVTSIQTRSQRHTFVNNRGAEVQLHRSSVNVGCKQYAGQWLVHTDAMKFAKVLPPAHVRCLWYGTAQATGHRATRHNAPCLSLCVALCLALCALCSGICALCVVARELSPVPCAFPLGVSAVCCMCCVLCLAS